MAFILNISQAETPKNRYSKFLQNYDLDQVVSSAILIDL